MLGGAQIARRHHGAKALGSGLRTTIGVNRAAFCLADAGRRFADPTDHALAIGCARSIVHGNVVDLDARLANTREGRRAELARQAAIVARTGCAAAGRLGLGQRDTGRTSRAAAVVDSTGRGLGNALRSLRPVGLVDDPAILVAGRASHAGQRIWPAQVVRIAAQQLVGRRQRDELIADLGGLTIHRSRQVCTRRLVLVLRTWRKLTGGIAAGGKGDAHEGKGTHETTERNLHDSLHN